MGKRFQCLSEYYQKIPDVLGGLAK